MSAPAAAAAAASPVPAAGDVRVGTAGYNYAHWRKGAFYPRGLTHDKELRHYSGVFSAVEINSSFHGVPREETLKSWAAAAKAGFKFALKAPQEITHVARLAGVDSAVEFFFERVQRCLGADALGPVLFQLPPSLARDLGKLRALAAAVPAGALVALEFRHASWYCDEVYDELRKHNFALCENVSPDASTHHVDVVTADWCYTRFHKVVGQGVTDYPDDKLKEAAKRVEERRKRGLNQVLFFLNDHEANAPKNGRTLVKEVAALAGTDALVRGWIADPVVEKGGRGSIEAMFARAKRPAPAAAASPSQSGVGGKSGAASGAGPAVAAAQQPLPSKRPKPSGNVKSPAKSPASGKPAAGSIMSFFKKK